MDGGDWWTRRDVMIAGALTAAAGVLACTQDQGASESRPAAGDRPAFRTDVCDLLGIEYPVLQAPMSRIVTPQMVAAVSNIGGLGIFPGIGVDAEGLRQAIAQIRQLTDRPFGVNLILHKDLVAPVDPTRIPESTLVSVQRLLNQFRREVGIPDAGPTMRGFPDLIDAAIEVIIEERVPVFSIGLGNPSPRLVDRCHANGIKVIAMVSTVEDAVAVSRSGVDVIAAQGSDAGGHRSTWEKRPSPQFASIGTFSLVPQVVDVVSQPVVAAGGITDGRGLLAAVALGASGVLVGTRFIATSESAAPTFYKDALVERSSDDTVLTDSFTGLYARVLRNRFAERYGETGTPVLPAGIQQNAVADIVSAAAQAGIAEYYPLYAGQGVGMIRDVPGAASIVGLIVAEAREEMARLGGRTAV